MIKGVTKSIIEINPKNSCFEKIIVILNSSCETPPDHAELRREAELLAGTAPDFIKRQRGANRLKMAISAVSGSLVTAGALVILYMFV